MKGLSVTTIVLLMIFTVWMPRVSRAQSDQRCFTETGYCMSGRLREFWEQNGGLPVFGYPIAPQETIVVEGETLQGQWFQRYRLELHPQLAKPYDVLLGRLGDERLRQMNRDWFTFPKADPKSQHYFAATGHAIAPQFWDYWRTHGLEFDGRSGVSFNESLALFGMPISEPALEVNPTDHKSYVTQWFERARFEYHTENTEPYVVLLGLLASELISDPSSTQTISLLVSATPQETDVLRAQLDDFTRQSGINVTLTIVPFTEFNTQLLSQITAGAPPDVAVLSFNHVIAFQGQNLLAPLQLGPSDRDDFLADALSSNAVDDQVYALPWKRSACLPRYQNLGVFATTQHLQEATKLVNFLVQPEKQVQNYKELQAFPTRISVQSSLGLVCQASEPIRFPEYAEQTIDLATRAHEDLSPLLDPKQINIYESVPIVQDGVVKGAAAAMTNPVSASEFADQLPKGIYVGGLFVRESLDIRDAKGEVVDRLGVGVYAVKWVGDKQPSRFILVQPDGKEIPISTAFFQPTGAPVGTPTVVVVRGSVELCWVYGEWRGCVTI